MCNKSDKLAVWLQDYLQKQEEVFQKEEDAQELLPEAERDLQREQQTMPLCIRLHQNNQSENVNDQLRQVMQLDKGAQEQSQGILKELKQLCEEVKYDEESSLDCKLMKLDDIDQVSNEQSNSQKLEEQKEEEAEVGRKRQREDSDSDNHSWQMPMKRQRVEIAPDGKQSIDTQKVQLATPSTMKTDEQSP